MNRTIDIKPAIHGRDGALQARKSRFFDIIEKIVDGVVIVDTHGIVRFVNPAATALFDRQAEDLLGELFGLPIVTGETKEVDIIRRGVEPVTGEMRVTKIEWEGEDAYLASIRDISDRKRAEAAETEARENAERIRQLEKEVRLLAPLSSPPQTGVTARMYGTVTLIEGFPDTFRNLVDGYETLMDLALDQQAYKVKHDISGRLGAMAETLGFYKAGPRDVVDIHTTALKEKGRKAVSVEKKKAYTGEGWIMVLELMGHLVSFYRNRAQGTGSFPNQKTKNRDEAVNMKGE